MQVNKIDMLHLFHVSLYHFYIQFYRGYCKDQRKAAFIILQQTHGYWKIDAHHYIQGE
jgi:hypothetical protein